MTKRTAYVGLAGPFGYDYTNYSNPGAAITEKPIIENQLGLIVFYDEILFLSKSLCPPELRDLPYIKFANEEPTYSEAIEVAASQTDFNLFSGISLSPEFAIFGSVRGHIIGNSGLGDRIDNHSKYLDIPGALGYANSMDPRCIIADMYIAHALNISPYDIIFSSAAVDFLERTHRAENQEEIASAYAHANSSRQITEYLATLRIPNRYSPDGCYHPSMEALRDIPNRHEYREMLDSQDIHNADLEKLANELSSRAAKIVLDAVDHHTADSHLFTTSARPVADLATSILTPPPVNGFVSGFRAGQELFNNWTERLPKHARFIAEISDKRLNPQ